MSDFIPEFAWQCSAISGFIPEIHQALASISDFMSDFAVFARAKPEIISDFAVSPVQRFLGAPAMKTPVFAIDVGYGNTKYAYRAASGTVATGMFPSLAPLAASRALSGYGEGVLRSRKVAIVTIDQIEY